MNKRCFALVVILCVAVCLVPVPGTLAGKSVGALTIPVEYRAAVRHVAPEQEEASGSWPMAGANPQRTSWNTEEVPGSLKPVWYRTIEAYIPPRTQIIASNDLLFVSTAKGLYALHTGTGPTGGPGEVAWVYPTELPLAHSPTVDGGVAYVGGLDRKLHAIDALTGQRLWAFEAEAGFYTNPLVVNDRVYVGNRDGAMYAIYADGHPSKGTLAWKFETGGPVLFSAAFQDNTVYFASNDSYAYALDAMTGQLVWRSEKLLGAGFHSWWPVVYQDPGSSADVVVFAGSNNYRYLLPPAYGYDLQNKERNDIFPNRESEPRGTLIGQRLADGSVDATRALQYYEGKPWRRTFFVLERTTGQEVTFDFDGDNQAEYAPMLWHGTHSGNRFPPVVGADGSLYQTTTYMSDPYIPGGQLTGWQVGSSSFTTPSALWKAMDEPLASSAGGSLVYWNHCNDRSAGSFDVTIPNTHFFPDVPDSSREWTYWIGGANTLESLIPGYNVLYEATNPTDYTLNNLFAGPSGSKNGIYGQHGDQNPPIPYKGAVYLHRSNTVIALGNYSGQAIALPMAGIVPSVEPPRAMSSEQLEQMLAREVQKILDAGHLRPGYRSVGLFDGHTRDKFGDHLLDYWHMPSDTLYVLLLALPYLPEAMRSSVKTYVQSVYADFPPHQFTHVGWRDGAARDPFELPAEAEADRVNHPPNVSGYGYDGWDWPPHMFYGLWKYAEVFGSARDIFDQSKSKLEPVPADAYLAEFPYIHNAYIAGYLGYLELERLAGHPESSQIRSELDRLLALRASAFSKDVVVTDIKAVRALSVARNFMFLVPELGDYLRQTALGKVEEALEEYSEVAPYWFVSNFEVTHGEGAVQHLFDYHAIFLARAMILQEHRSSLGKYLDVPGTQVGDLFYIQNLVAALEATNSLEKGASVTSSHQGESIKYTVDFSGGGSPLVLVDTLPEGVSAPSNWQLEGTGVLPVYDADLHRWTWSDAPPAGQQVVISYDVTITTDSTMSLVNTAELSEPGMEVSAAESRVIANPFVHRLPVANAPE